MGNPPGSDVFDPADHVLRRLRVRGEVQYERTVGWQLEFGRARARVPP
jgi:hypothetical protein